MNIYKLFVSPSGGGDREEWEVMGEHVYDAFHRLQHIKPHLVRLLGYKIMEGNDEQSDSHGAQ